MFVADGFGDKGKPASSDGGAVPPNATLSINLELVSWKIVTNVTDDKKVIKKVLKEGEGYEKPNEGAVVKGRFFIFLLLDFFFQLCMSFLKSNLMFFLFFPVKIVAKLGDGTIFFKRGHDGNEDDLFEFKTDEGILAVCLSYVLLLFHHCCRCLTSLFQQNK